MGSTDRGINKFSNFEFRPFNYTNELEPALYVNSPDKFPEKSWTN